MRKNLLSIMLFLCFVLSQAYSQDRTVTGAITDKADGSALPGVSVVVKGSRIGTQTSGNGRYSIVVPTGQSLVFTYIGYSSQTLSVNGNILNVSLEIDAKQLNEVVVTGVGTATQKRLVAIDVSTVASKDFAKSAVTNVTQSLTGQIAGAQVISRSGRPGTNATIILRGPTSLGSTSPLIVIDGAQADNDLLNSLDPNIVDRIEVVKGAAGGMLYGSAGGNGVIQIFTKKGAKNSRLIIDASTKYSNDKVLKNNDLVARMHHYITDASGNILDGSNKVVAPDVNGAWSTPTEVDYTANKLVVNDKPYLLPTYDHIDQGFRVANTFTHNLNIRGGSEKSDYLFGVTQLSQQDVYSNDFSRTSINANLGFTPVKGLSLRNSTQLIAATENLLNASRFNLVNSFPYIDFNYINPATGRHVVKPSTLIDGNNVLAEKDVHTRNSKTPRLVENFNANYKFPKFIELDYKFSLDYRNIDGYDTYANQTDLPQSVFFGTPITGSVFDSYENYKVTYHIGSLFARADFKNDFHLNIPIKTTTQFSYDSRRVNDRYFDATGTVLPPYPPVNLNVTTTKTSSDSNSESLFYGFLINQTIDYANLFGVSGGFRSDYSSAFGGQSKPFTYPRGTVYFNPSELFSNHDLIHNWKVRAAYGKAGVQPGAYDRQVTLTAATVGIGGSSLYLPAALRNEQLAVQVTTETEIGTDLNMAPLKGAWLNSLSFSGSYWKRSSDDVIQNAPVALSTGGGTIISNLVGLNSRGVDLSLDANVFKSSNFEWNMGLRWAKAKTTITKISNNLPITSGPFNLAINQDLGVLMGQTPLHSVDQLKPNGTRYIPAANVGNYTLVDGKVVNLANYNVVLTASDDQSIIGNTNPDFTSSLINRITIYKKLNIAFQFDWYHGNDVYNQTRQWLYRDNLSADYDKPVNINGTEGAYVAYYKSFYNALAPVSWFVEDASFVRLRDLSASYDLTSLIKGKWMRSLVLTASGRNVLTFSKYKGLDPEATGALTSQGGSVGNVGSAVGVDYYSAPNLRSFQFGLNIGF